MVARDWGREEEELVLNGDRVWVWEDKEDLEMDGGDSCTEVSMCLMPQNCTLKMVKKVNVMYILLK